MDHAGSTYDLLNSLAIEVIESSEALTLNKGFKAQNTEQMIQESDKFESIKPKQVIAPRVMRVEAVKN